MSAAENSDDDLRQQLRKAWQHIAELEWRLQSEQHRTERQGRQIVSGATALRESREQHEYELAERDQDMADLEDAEYLRDKKLAEGDRTSDDVAHRPDGLTALAELLRFCAQHPDNAGFDCSVRAWQHRAELMLNLRQAASLPLESTLRRTVFAPEARRTVSWQVEPAVSGAISLQQMALLTLLLDEWSNQAAARSGPDVPSASISHRSDERGGIEIQIRLSSSQSGDWLQPFVAALGARIVAEAGSDIALSIASQRTAEIPRTRGM